MMFFMAVLMLVLMAVLITAQLWNEAQKARLVVMPQLRALHARAMSLQCGLYKLTPFSILFSPTMGKHDENQNVY